MAFFLNHEIHDKRAAGFTYDESGNILTAVDEGRQYEIRTDVAFR